MFPIIMAAIAAGISMASGFSGSMRQGAEQRQQAKQMEANSWLARENASRSLRKGYAEAYELDRQRARLTRDFRQKQGINRAALGAGNVDMSSGSALDVSHGNIDAYALDMADNKYAVAMKKWESQAEYANLHNQADVLEANASYLNRTAPNLLSSIISSALGGIGSGVSAYSAAGGSFGLGKGK